MAKQEINKYEILEKITPLIENTAMRFGYVPIEIEFVKENQKAKDEDKVESLFVRKRRNS